MIDNVITNSILPNLSRSILNTQLSKGSFSKAIVRMQNGQFACSIE
jgi:type VI secretion system protein VasG